MRRVTRRVTSKSRLWINELKVSWLLKRVYYFQCIFLKYLDQRLDSFDSFPEDTVTTRHLSTLWISANKNWTFACLALAKINYKTRILKKPSTLDTSTKSQTHVRNSKKEETCQGHVLHFNGWRGWQLKRLRIGRSRENPHATQATNINNTRFEKQQTVTLLVTQSRQSQESSATPWCHTLSIFLTLPRREIFCSVCLFSRQWEKIRCSFTVWFLYSVSILLYSLLF